MGQMVLLLLIISRLPENKAVAWVTFLSDIHTQILLAISQNNFLA